MLFSENENSKTCSPGSGWNGKCKWVVTGSRWFYPCFKLKPKWLKKGAPKVCFKNMELFFGIVAWGADAYIHLQPTLILQKKQFIGPINNLPFDKHYKQHFIEKRILTVISIPRNIKLYRTNTSKLKFLL